MLTLFLTGKAFLGQRGHSARCFEKLDSAAPGCRNHSIWRRRGRDEGLCRIRPAPFEQGTNRLDYIFDGAQEIAQHDIPGQRLSPSGFRSKACLPKRLGLLVARTKQLAVCAARSFGKQRGTKADLNERILNQCCSVHPKQYISLEEVVRVPQPPPPSGVRVASRLLLVCLRNAVREKLDSIKGKGSPRVDHSHPRSRPKNRACHAFS